MPKQPTVSRTIDGAEYECIIKAISTQHFDEFKLLDIATQEDGDVFLEVPLNDLRMYDSLDEYSGVVLRTLEKAISSGAELLLVYRRKGHKEN